MNILETAMGRWNISYGNSDSALVMALFKRLPGKVNIKDGLWLMVVIEMHDQNVSLLL